MKIDTPETVLLAVTGISPATLTETVWALAHEAEPVIPARVVTVTTLLGRDMIRQQLFQASARFGGQTAWQALREALETEGIDIVGRLRFGETPDDIRVITTSDQASGCSRELEDIRTPADNEATADFLLDQVRSFVENPDVRLIASIAGGRKTMGALLYASMTLAGREGDRLTHVLVSEPFETITEFLFPDQAGGMVIDRSGKSYDPAAARIELAGVPFVPLRNLFSRELGRTAGTFSRLVDQCRQNIRKRASESIELEIETGRPEIRVNHVSLRLPPRAHVVMLYLARRAKEGAPALPAYKDAVDEIRALCNELREQAKDWADWRHRNKLTISFSEEDIRKATSELSKRIKSVGGEAATLAACLPERGRFSLSVIPSRILIK